MPAFVADQSVYQLVGGQSTINDFDSLGNPRGPLPGLDELTIQAVRKGS